MMKVRIKQNFKEETVGLGSIEGAWSAFFLLAKFIFILNFKKWYILAVTEEKKSTDSEKKADEDAAIEDDKEEVKKKKTKTVDKTVWDWELMNESKPIWQRK